jgi:hypothetical protein
VTVVDSAGAPVASGRGDGQNVNWTWDATLAPVAGYTYSIDAGPDVRPVTGAVGRVATALAVTGAQARPAVVTPNGDRITESTTISYSLTMAATVTATLRDEFGQTTATLFVEPKQAGRQTFRFAAAGIPDGRYVVVLSAESNGRAARTEVPVLVDRTLGSSTVTPGAFSPNGDGRLDQVTFAFTLAAPAQVKVAVVGGPVAFEGALEPGSHRIPWTGRLRDGKRAAVIQATTPLGTRAQTVRFVADTTKPRLRLLSRAARRLWASERGTAVFTAKGRRFVVAVKGGAFTAPVGGRVRVVLWDQVGNRSAVLRYP